MAAGEKKFIGGQSGVEGWGRRRAIQVRVTEFVAAGPSGTFSRCAGSVARNGSRRSKHRENITKPCSRGRSPIDRHLPSTNPLPSFVSNLTQKSPGFTAMEKENNKGISSFQIYEELLEIIDRIAIERREHREIPFNFIRGTRILTRHGKTSYPLGGGDKFPRSFRSRIVEKAI